MEQLQRIVLNAEILSCGRGMLAKRIKQLQYYPNPFENVFQNAPMRLIQLMCFKM